MHVKLDKVKTISSCNKCISMEANIVEINKVIWKYEKGQISLENVLNKQKHTNDKSGLGYHKFKSSSQNKKTIFVKSNNTCNNIQSINVCYNVQLRNAYNKNYFYDHKTKMPYMIHTYFYYNSKGHTPNACHMRKISLPSEKYAWIEKETSKKGSKEFWICRKKH